ncbi:hypothetical protein E1B28_004039 [Marasmius oreades]|uniref:Manganese/iron superoxide dismutase C-terminal domain-containing protein n=1 Tax=Marasmius oreades TaxID=181124 RepID=A0A9P7UXT4_9AGAR|nr:uncharacterized protein E1B28_004039 [Marasmius oreades]KAG7096622.1 hypothetical protein E1B28_004039 [Marasmius oreades]
MLSRLRCSTSRLLFRGCHIHGRLSYVRALHTPVQLKYRLEEGLGEFLPPPALHTVAVEYQQGLLDRLNEEVRGTELEGMSVVDTIIKTSTERHHVLAFNYASLALNNHFFLEHLKPIPSDSSDHQHTISLHLQTQIRSQHGSLAQLKSTFSSAALGMFTSGHVWLVTDAGGNIAVLPTFGPGTMLVRSRTYMAPTFDSELGLDMLQSLRGQNIRPGDPYAKEFVDEMKHFEGASAEESSSTSPTPTPTQKQPLPGVTPSSPASGVSPTSSGPGSQPPHTRSFHSTLSAHLPPPPPSGGEYEQAGLYGGDPTTPTRGFKRTELYLMGEKLYPLLCLSVHEHAWMSAGYGVWGKEEWVKRFWAVVDWEKVSRNYEFYVSTEGKARD